MVRTAAVQRDDMLAPWMERMEPLILVGPEGCGKHMLLSKLFAQQRSCQVAVASWLAQTPARTSSASSPVCATPRRRRRCTARATLRASCSTSRTSTCPSPTSTTRRSSWRSCSSPYQGFYDKNPDFAGLQNGTSPFDEPQHHRRPLPALGIGKLYGHRALHVGPP